MKKKDDKQSILSYKKRAIKLKKKSVQTSWKYSRFRVSSKREKCPPRVETATGKRQPREKSGHMTKGRCVSNEWKIFILEIHFVPN